MPRRLALAAGALAVLEMWLLAMVRESPYDSIARVLSDGPQLPALLSFERVASNYDPALARFLSPWLFLGACVAAVALIWLVRLPRRRELAERAQGGGGRSG
jgi:hypothetical protein